MSRAVDGTYTLPLPDVVTGDTIEATWANSTLADIETALTDSLSRTGNGNMSNPLKVVAGTVSAPGLSFTSEANSGLYRASAGDIRMALSGAEFYRITSAGLRLASNGIILATAGKGIDFSANAGTAASGATTTSEVFSWYEEGTWTPILTDTSGSASESQTFSTNYGRFTRMGNIVLFSCDITVTSLGTLTTSDDAYIIGLPFTANASYGPHSGLSVGFSSNLNLATSPMAISAYITSNGSSIRLIKWSATTGSTPLTVAEVSADGRITVGGHYLAAI